MQRVQIIQYLAENKEQSCISAGELFNVSPKAILKWIKKVNESGDLESLREKSGRGRKTSLTKDQIATIEKVIKENPKKAGIKAGYWTGAILAKYITEGLGVEMQTRQCQRMLQQMGASNQRGRPWN